jgi:hypothetical protein
MVHDRWIRITMAANLLFHPRRLLGRGNRKQPGIRFTAGLASGDGDHGRDPAQR